MSREDPQLKLRLPEGLRDRIKAYADRHGRSMNAEIVRILEREFPEPWVAGARIEELLDMISVLQRSNANEDGIAKLVSELKETVVGIYSGRVKGLDKETRARINKQYQEWQEREFEYEQDIASMDYDEVESESLSRTGTTEKYVHEDGSIGPQHGWDPLVRGGGRQDPDSDPFEDGPFEDKK
jgi:hypothetical protein